MPNKKIAREQKESPNLIGSEEILDFLSRIKKENKGMNRREEKVSIIRQKIEKIQVGQKDTENLDLKNPAVVQSYLKEILTEAKKLVAESQQAVQRIVSTRQIVTLGGRDSMGKIDVLPIKERNNKITGALNQTQKEAARFLFELIDYVLYEMEINAKAQMSSLHKLRDEILDLI